MMNEVELVTSVLIIWQKTNLFMYRMSTIVLRRFGSATHFALHISRLIHWGHTIHMNFFYENLNQNQSILSLATIYMIRKSPTEHACKSCVQFLRLRFYLQSNLESHLKISKKWMTDYELLDIRPFHMITCIG